MELSRSQPASLATNLRGRKRELAPSFRFLSNDPHNENLPHH